MKISSLFNELRYGFPRGLKLNEEKMDFKSFMGFILYIISGWDSVYQMIGDSTVTLSLMMGRRFYNLLRSFNMIPEFNGRNIKDIRDYLIMVSGTCSLPVNDIIIKVNKNVFNIDFYTPFQTQNPLIDQLSQFFGWKNMTSVLVGTAVFLLSKIVGRNFIITGYHSDFKEGIWRNTIILKLREDLRL